MVSAVTFEIGDRDPRTPTAEDENKTGWECVWKCHTATPVHHMAFSPDGTLFATSGKSDRLVKVWYESKHCKYILEMNIQVQIIFTECVFYLQYYFQTKAWIVFSLLQ